MKYSRPYIRVVNTKCLIAAVAGLAAIGLIASNFLHTSAHSNLNSVTTETVEETVSLSPSALHRSGHGYEWYPALPYCGPPFHIFPPLDDVPGSVVAGYEHYYDKGAKVFGCKDGAMAVSRGSVWFDLSGIIDKAPPLHVFVKTAKLSFKKDKNCPGQELLLGNKNWMKSWPEGELVPGDPFLNVPESEDPDSSVEVDVATVLNNWVKGKDHGGYANYGFVFKGINESDQSYTDNNACIVRYSDISLTVTYKYDKTPTVLYVPPERPTILVNPAVTAVNVASAASGATATAKDFTRDDAYPGLHFQPQYAIDGGLYLHPPSGDWYWRDEHGLPSWLEVDFNKPRKIREIDVFTVADAGEYYVDPKPASTCTTQGATAFDVQYWDGSAWVMIPGGSITGNNLVWRKITFPPVTTTKIRVIVNAAPDRIARIAEVQAF